MGERVAELAALVDRARRLGGGVARDPARKRELAEEHAQARLVAADVRVELAVGALEIGVRDHGRSAVPGPGHVDHVEVILLDDAVQMSIDEVQAGCGSPVAKQARLHVFELQRRPEKRIVVEINLSYRQIVCRTPVSIQFAQRIG